MQTIPFKTKAFAEEENPQRTSPLIGDSHAEVVNVDAGIIEEGSAVDSCSFNTRVNGRPSFNSGNSHVYHARVK